MLYFPTISQKFVSKIWIKPRFYPYHPLVHTTGVFGRNTKNDRFFGDGKEWEGFQNRPGKPSTILRVNVTFFGMVSKNVTELKVCKRDGIKRSRIESPGGKDSCYKNISSSLVHCQVSKDPY